jgi:hypothetical protein
MSNYLKNVYNKTGIAVQAAIDRSYTARALENEKVLIPGRNNLDKIIENSKFSIKTVGKVVNVDQQNSQPL